MTTIEREDERRRKADERRREAERPSSPSTQPDLFAGPFKSKGPVDERLILTLGDYDKTDVSLINTAWLTGLDGIPGTPQPKGSKRAPGRASTPSSSGRESSGLFGSGGSSPRRGATKSSSSSRVDRPPHRNDRSGPKSAAPAPKSGAPSDSAGRSSHGHRGQNEGSGPSYQHKRNSSREGRDSHSKSYGDRSGSRSGSSGSRGPKITNPGDRKSIS
jgi:hypothetical protein